MVQCLKLLTMKVLFVSFSCTQDKPCPRKRTIFDYNNVDVDALFQHIKFIYIDLLVFFQPFNKQVDLSTDILTEVFSKLVPCKSITIRQQDQPWTNTYTELLLRNKNCNFRLFKQANT